jgi:hypothetical protein
MGNLITNYPEVCMDLVDTEAPDRRRFARTSDGKIDFDAYEGLRATTDFGPLVIEVQIIGARQRYGHLDLLCTPIAGLGERWIERKNLVINDDPADAPAESYQDATVADSTPIDDVVAVQDDDVLSRDAEGPLAAVRALLSTSHVK